MKCDRNDSWASVDEVQACSTVPENDTEEWLDQMANQANSLERLSEFIHVTQAEKEAIETLDTNGSPAQYTLCNYRGELTAIPNLPE